METASGAKENAFMEDCCQVAEQLPTCMHSALFQD